MTTPVKLGGFALILSLIFGTAYGAGQLIGPTAAAEETQHGGMGETEMVPGGLQIAQDGYRLEPPPRQLSTNDSQPFSFRVIGPDGKPLTAYATEHEKELHLIVARRDLTGFQHLHPARDAGAEVPSDGIYGLFLDFKHGGTVQTAGFTATAGH